MSGGAPAGAVTLTAAAQVPTQAQTPGTAFDDADLERRFGGLRRLHGDAGYGVIRAARCAVVGLGGVGSWVAEALARSGVAGLVLIDLDHVSESNINRQVQALGRTLGASKGEALRERIADIHPGCAVEVVEEFVDADNWPALLVQPVDVMIDACDQVRAKAVLATWALRSGVPAVVVGAAGGKQRPQDVEVADLARVTHDPLLAALRQRLRQRHGAAESEARPEPAVGRAAGAGAPPMGLSCVFSREAVATPQNDCAIDGTLNCHGYGSTVTVTATFGMVAAAQAMALLLRRSA